MTPHSIESRPLIVVKGGAGQHKCLGRDNWSLDRITPERRKIRKLHKIQITDNHNVPVNFGRHKRLEERYFAVLLGFSNNRMRAVPPCWVVDT